MLPHTVMQTETHCFFKQPELIIFKGNFDNLVIKTCMNVFKYALCASVLWQQHIDSLPGRNSPMTQAVVSVLKHLAVRNGQPAVSFHFQEKKPIYHFCLNKWTENCNISSNVKHIPINKLLRDSAGDRGRYSEPMSHSVLRNNSFHSPLTVFRYQQVALLPVGIPLFSLAEDGWTFRDELTCQNRNLPQRSSTFCCCTRSADKLCFCLNGSCESEQPITAVSCSTSRQEATWKKKRGERKRKRERVGEGGSPLDFIVLLSRRSKKQMLLAIKWWLTQHKGACLFACLE